MSYDDFEESEFCECGVTLMGDPGESDRLCTICNAAPHGRDCPCDECDQYWARVCEESTIAAERANRQLVCTCGWAGAFIEHHNSEAYGPTARAGCEIVYRCPADERQRSVRKAWTGSEWQQVPM